ncbi:MAG: TetR/AcrR family transcriptional regulator [Candidatus Nanopelagicales bacterium]
MGTDSAVEPASDERILRATIDALTRMDPSAVTIQRICQEASVTAPTLYYHFGNKDGLVAAAIERLVSDWVDLLDRQISREGSLEQALEQAVQGWESMIRAPDRPLAVFVWLTLLTAGTPVESRDALIRARDRSRDLVGEALRSYVTDAHTREILAGMVLDAVVAAAIEYQLDQDVAGLRMRLTSMTRTVQVVVGTVTGSDG